MGLEETLFGFDLQCNGGAVGEGEWTWNARRVRHFQSGDQKTDAVVGTVAGREARGCGRVLVQVKKLVKRLHLNVVLQRWDLKNEKNDEKSLVPETPKKFMAGSKTKNFYYESQLF